MNTLTTATPARTRRKPAPTTLPPEAYDCVPRVSVTLTDESAWLTRYTLRGEPCAAYPVALAEVAGALNTFGANTGLLPENILFWQRSRNQDRVGLWLPPAIRRLPFTTGQRKSEFLSVPLPGFVFVGQGREYRIWAARTRPSALHEQLGHAPLPNVYSDGRVCAGSVAFPVCAPQSIQAATALFFESHFNNDLGGQRVAGNEKTYTFLRGLRGARAFPMARLLPATTMGAVLGGAQQAAGENENEQEEELRGAWD